MAEFLIKKRDSWAITKPQSWTQAKFDARGRSGDIIEVQEDGFFRIESLKVGRVGWNRDAFAVIRVPRLDKARCLDKVGALENGDVLIKKFRFTVPMTIAWTKNNVTINGITVEEWYIDVNKITEIGIIDKAN